MDKNTSKSKIVAIQGYKKQYMMFQEQFNKFGKSLDKNSRTIVMLLVWES